MLVECRGITKYFGGVQALNRVSLAVHSGEVVALVGDNGAGKSSLVSVLSGLYDPDEGDIFVANDRVGKMTTQKARALGIETVYQTLALCDTLSASANVVLGQEPVWRFRLGPIRFVDERRAREEAKRLLAEVGASLNDFDVPVARLSGGQRQAVAIARALMHAHRMVILDEPTAALGVRQTAASLRVIRGVADRGVAVMMITHNLEEVFAVADRIIALRLGSVVLDVPRLETTRESVIAAMTGMVVGANGR